MDVAQKAEIASWVVAAGLDGMPEPDLLQGFCERLIAAGVPLCRGVIIADTLHPVFEGRLFRWERDPSDAAPLVEFERVRENDPRFERWRQSPFHTLLQDGRSELRRCLARGEPADYPMIEELRNLGHTDYIALISRFAAEGAIGELDCILSSWSTDALEGFDDDQLALLRRLVPILALAIKTRSLARIAATLVETYLGRGAGRRVMAGRIERGVAEKLRAVLWYSDLRGFTGITDTAAPGQIIPLLNDYAEAVIASIHEAGGDVLKLIGDGTLAIFDASDPADGCRSALLAKDLAKERIQAVSARRAEAGLPITQAYLGLHVGEVLFGNIGSPDRLDFTVVGPAVNEVARIAAMCRSVERKLLVSTAFHAAATSEDRARLVSVGRYALRGVGAAQDLYTVEA
jgi:adenylate cyclase